MSMTPVVENVRWESDLSSFDAVAGNPPEADEVDAITTDYADAMRHLIEPDPEEPVDRESAEYVFPTDDDTEEEDADRPLSPLAWH